MIKSKFKRVTSLFLATLMCVTTFAGIGSTTAYAASGEKADVYMVDFPRDGDVILSILVYTFFSRMFDLMLPPVAKHSIVVA